MIRFVIEETAITPTYYKFLADLFRKVGVFGTMCLFLKATYFLSLLDPVAPLIDIIF
jgi:hypothetical protein